MQIGILTGGGDAPGLNAAIRGVARSAFAAGADVLGVRNGWAGLLEVGDASPLRPADVSGILTRGGTILGTSRANPLAEDGAMEVVATNLGRLGIDALVAMGGDDTLSVAAALAERGLPVVGVPKTVDNDLQVTEYCIGFDTAVSVVTEAVDRLHSTAASHHRVMVVEAMGREAGWVTLMGGLAGGADMIVIPEFAVNLEEVIDHLHQRRRQGKTFSIIAVSEGAEVAGLPTPSAGGEPVDAFGHVQLSRRGIGERLGRQLEDVTGFETRVTVLGHTQRGGTPTAYDRIWATRVGVAAYELVRDGRFGAIPVKRGDRVETARLSEVITEPRLVPEDLYRLAQIFY
ncbi:MAG: ATP-dependent 6-phosphofructokinase [Candidatus Dormibacteria bacterium]